MVKEDKRKSEPVVGPHDDRPTPSIVTGGVDIEGYAGQLAPSPHPTQHPQGDPYPLYDWDPDSDGFH